MHASRSGAALAHHRRRMRLLAFMAKSAENRCAKRGRNIRKPLVALETRTRYVKLRWDVRMAKEQEKTDWS